MPDAHLGDEPTETDLLGFTPLVENLSALILAMKISDTPLCVGVYGEWGSGKTSFLKMVTKKIRNSGDVQSIWFNAWKYDREENLWAALLQSVLTGSVAQGTIAQRAIVKWKLFWNSLDLREGIWVNVRRIAPALLRIGVIVLLVSIALLAKDPTYQALVQSIAQKLQVGGSGVRAVLAGLVLSIGGSSAIWNLANTRLGFDFDAMWKKPSYKKHIAFLDEFQDELRRLIELVGRGRPICIVIDDLDRCLPEKAISVLEAIKQFLDVPGCIFLVALDQELLERAVTAKFRELVREREDQLRKVDQAKFASGYVEKIVQLPISLPVSHTERTISFIKELFPGRDTSAWAEVFALGLSRNPRRIKRALRVFQFLELGAASQVSADALDRSLLAKLIVIQHEARDIFLQVSKRPALLVAMEEVAKGAKIPATGERVALLSMAEDRLTAAPDVRQMLSLASNERVLTDDTVTLHLNFMMQTLEPTASTPGPSTESNVATWQHYLTVLERQKNFERAIFVEPRFRRARGANLETDSTERRTLVELLKGSLRVLLVGGAGTGKTLAVDSAVALLAREHAVSKADQDLAAEKGEPASERLVPIAVRARDLQQHHDVLGACLAEVQNRIAPDVTLEALSQLFTTGEAILFIDGFDELAVNYRDGAIRQLSSLFARYPAMRAVISTRPVFEWPLQTLGLDVFEILPFDTKQRQELVAQLAVESGLPADAQGRFNELLDAPEYLGLGAVPLFTRWLFEVFKDTGQVPVGRARMLSALTDLFLFSRDQAKGVSPSVDLSTSKLVLAWIAYRLRVRDEHTFGLRDIEAACVEIGMGDHSLNKVVQHLLERTGLVVSDAIGEFRFAHRTVEEYFAAEGLLREMVRSLDVIDDLDQRWKEVLAFAVEMAEQDFVGKILDKLIQSSTGLELFSEVVQYADAIGMKRMSDLREKLLALQASEPLKEQSSRAMAELERSARRRSGGNN